MPVLFLQMLLFRLFLPFLGVLLFPDVQVVGFSVVRKVLPVDGRPGEEVVLVGRGREVSRPEAVRVLVLGVRPVLLGGWAVHFAGERSVFFF